MPVNVFYLFLLYNCFYILFLHLKLSWYLWMLNKNGRHLHSKPVHLSHNAELWKAKRLCVGWNVCVDLKRITWNVSTECLWPFMQVSHFLICVLLSTSAPRWALNVSSYQGGENCLLVFRFISSMVHFFVIWELEYRSYDDDDDYNDYYWT